MSNPAITPEGWDVYTALKNGYTLEQFNDWQFLGYDLCGDEIRRNPKENDSE